VTENIKLLFSLYNFHSLFWLVRRMLGLSCCCSFINSSFG